MPLNSTEETTTLNDLSRGVQRKTTRFQGREGEVWGGENTRFKTIGGVSKALGYVQRASDLTSTSSTSTSSSTTTTSTSTSTSTTTTTSTSTS